MGIKTLKKIHVKSFGDRTLGLRPNAVARGLAMKTTTVGVDSNIILYFSTLAKGMTLLKCTKYNIVLAEIVMNDDKEVSEVVNNLFSKQVDGIIFMGYHLTERFAQFSLSDARLSLLGPVDVEHQLQVSANRAEKQATVDAVTGKTQQEIAFL